VFSKSCPSALAACLTIAACAERGGAGAPSGAEVGGPAESVAAAQPDASATPVRSVLVPIAGPRVVQYDVEGFGPVTVDLPVGATGKRPVLVALHAHAIRPEQACADWRRASGDWPFVVCPFGVPARAGKHDPVTVGTAEYSAREIEAGLEVLHRKFPEHAVISPVVFAGYSLGAKVGADVVGRLGPRVSAAVFGEGGYDVLTQAVVDGYARAGLHRAFLLCSTRACELSFEPVAARLRKAGINVRIAGAGSTRHPFEGEVIEVARRNWPWLIEDDPRFKGTEESNP